MNVEANGSTGTDTADTPGNGNNLTLQSFTSFLELYNKVRRSHNNSGNFQVEFVKPTIPLEDILNHLYLADLVYRDEFHGRFQEFENTVIPPLERQPVLKNVHIFLLDRIQVYPGKIIPLFTTIHSEASLFLRCLRHEPNPPLLCIAGCQMGAFESELHFGCLVRVKRGYLCETNHHIRMGVLLECTQPCEVLSYSQNLDRTTLGTVQLSPFSVQFRAREDGSLLGVFSKQFAQLELPNLPLLRRNRATSRA